jgi:hypothetical protein
MACGVSTKTVQKVKKENRRITLREKKVHLQFPKKFKFGQITIALRKWILYIDTTTTATNKQIPWL